MKRRRDEKGSYVTFAEYEIAPVATGLGVDVELEDGIGITLYNTVGLHIVIANTLIEYPLGRAVEEFATAEDVTSEELEKLVILDDVDEVVDDKVDFGTVMVLYIVVVDESVVCFVEASIVEELTSWNTLAAVLPEAGEEDVVLATEAATGLDEDGMATDGDITAAEPEDWKLLDAVVDAPLLTSTLSIITTSPLLLVILISTVVVPKPEDCSKKL